MNLTETPSISVLPSDPEASARAARAQFDQVMADVEIAEGVAQELAVFESATKRLADLKAARDGLNKRGKYLTEQLISAQMRLEGGLLAQFAEGGAEADVTAMVQAIQQERTESAAVTNVLRRLAEELIPGAYVAQLRAESRLFWARAAELTRVADERFEKTAELLRSATEFESGISIDVRATFSRLLKNEVAE